jgi:hypothetical protein
MDHPWRDKLIALIDAFRPGPRDKALLALRRLAEEGRLSEAMCRFHYQRLLQNPPRYIGSLGALAPPPTLAEWRAAVVTEVPIGVLTEVEGAEFGIRVSDRVEHWAVTGGTGAGKTVTHRRLASAVAASFPIPQLFFALKRDYVDMAQLLSVPCVRVANGGSPWFGLQAPAGVADRDWAMVIALILAARCGLKHATTSIARMLTWLVERLNAGWAGERLWPDLQLLCDVAVAAPPALFAAKEEYERSSIQVLDGLAHTLGPWARTFQGIDLERDCVARGISIVVDLSTLEPPAQWVVIDVLLSQLLIGPLARNEKCDRAKNVAHLDESDLLVTDLANATFPGEQSPLMRILRQGREFGIMMALGINDLAKTSESILNNIQNLVVLKHNAPATITKAARALMLHPQATGILKSLDRGDAVVRVAGWPEPVLGHVTYVAPHRGEVCTPPPELSIVPAKRLRELPELQEALAKATGELGRVRKGGALVPGKLQAHVHDVLAAWVHRPGTPLARIWQALKVRGPSVQDAIKAALSPEFAEIRDERLGSAKVALLRPTEAGYALVGRRPPTGLGRGELVHQHGAWWARDWALQQGYEAWLEWLVSGTRHPADVGYCANGTWHVIEIVDTCFNNLADAVRASLLVSNAVETVTIVTKLKGDHTRVRQLLAAEDLAPVRARVHLTTFDYYLRAVHG